MKSIAGLVLLLLAVPVSAQEIDFSEADDRQAIEIYITALRGGQEQDSCRLFTRYKRLGYLRGYSAGRSKTLGKLGIRPESVEVLRLQVAK